MKNVDKAVSNLEFELIFNQTKSSFGLVKNLFTDLDTKAAIAVLAVDDYFFVNKVNKTLLEEKDFLGKLFIAETPFKDLIWQLSKESKNIEGYTCFKAIGTREFVDRDFSKKTVFVYAWYTLEIPLSFGPFEPVGLPGLVLEFNDPVYSFVAFKIEFLREVDVKKPQKGKILSKDEFDNMVSGKVKTIGY